MGRYSYDSYTKQEVTTTTNKKEFPRVGYFYLTDDKPTAIVRFNISSTEDIMLVDVHNVNVGKTFRNIACLRENDNESWQKCPLCEHSIKTRTTKVFVEMLEYVYEDNKVVAKPVTWSRYKSFADELVRDLNDYGDLRECLFKITKIKSNGRVSYDVKYQPEKGIYTEDAGYVKDFSAFNNFLMNKHSYMERTYEELKTFVETGELATRKPASTETSVSKSVEKVSVEKPVVATAENLHESVESSEKINTSAVKETVVEKSIEKKTEEDDPTTVRRRRYEFTDDDSPF